MEEIFIKATDVSPEVVFSPKNKKYSISGWSRPESPSKFYSPLLKWIEEYGAKHLNNATVNFKIEYFNTPSARVLREVLDRLDILYKKGIMVNVNWYYDDESSKEEFEHEFAQGLTIPVSFVVKA